MYKQLPKTKYTASIALFIILFALPHKAWAQVDYDLEIAGTKVTSDNCNDLSVIDGITGTAVYDPATNTLTLDNATIRTTATYDEGIGLWNKLKRLTIRLIGENSIISEQSMGLYNHISRTLTITGSGKLTVKGSHTAEEELDQRGIINRGVLIVSGCTLEVSGGVTGLSSGYWRFVRCNMRIKGGGINTDKYKGSISYVWDGIPDFKGCKITSPKKFYWKKFLDGENVRFSLFGDDDKVVTDWVTIESTPSDYDLMIAGRKVNTTNCNNLSVIDGVSGTLKYAPATNTLTLSDATIHTTAEETLGLGIKNQIDGLIIYLVGNNTIISDNSGGISNGPKKNLTITGDGKLIVNGSTTGKNGYRYGIFNRGDLTVDGCTLESVGGLTGLTAGHWKFINCTVQAQGSGSTGDPYDGTFGWLWDKKPEFVGCSITSPAGTYWKKFEDGGYDYYSLFGADGKVVTERITISKESTKLITPTTDVPVSRRGIYNLMGMKLNKPFDQLPAGVYIVDGKQKVKK